MFNIIEYRSFLESNIRRTVHRKDAIPVDRIIDFCCQWDKSPADFFSMSTVSANRQLKIALCADDKPTNVSYNIYFLYLFGFYRCKKCNSVLSIDKFSKNSTAWNNIDYRCTLCANNRTSEWRKNNPGKAANQRAYRRAAEYNATPKWLSEKQKSEILHFYVEAWQLGLEVDHIVPLRGKTVCGLHVPWNLQLLDRSANAKKNNKFDGWSDI